MTANTRRSRSRLERLVLAAAWVKPIAAGTIVEQIVIIEARRSVPSSTAVKPPRRQHQDDKNDDEDGGEIHVRLYEAPKRVRRRWYNPLRGWALDEECAILLCSKGTK